jgi:hypothetical protein
MNFVKRLQGNPPVHGLQQLVAAYEGPGQSPKDRALYRDTICS